MTGYPIFNLKLYSHQIRVRKNPAKVANCLRTTFPIQRQIHVVTTIIRPVQRTTIQMDREMVKKKN